VHPNGGWKEDTMGSRIALLIAAICVLQATMGYGATIVPSAQNRYVYAMENVSWPAFSETETAPGMGLFDEYVHVSMDIGSVGADA